jgi:hypothetical protein
MWSRHLTLSEPIDLLNVAFQNPRKQRLQTNADNVPARKIKSKHLVETKDDSGTLNAAEDGYRVPDRISGLAEAEELRRVCPGRAWNFVEINVPFEVSASASRNLRIRTTPAGVSSYSLHR